MVLKGAHREHKSHLNTCYIDGFQMAVAKKMW